MNSVFVVLYHIFSTLVDIIPGQIRSSPLFSGYCDDYSVPIPSFFVYVCDLTNNVVC